MLNKMEKHVWEVTIFLSLPWKQSYYPFRNQNSKKYIEISLYHSQHLTVAGILADKYNLLVQPSPNYIIFTEGADRKVLSFILGALTGENM